MKRILLIMMCLCLIACGQRGPLYLPHEDVFAKRVALKQSSGFEVFGLLQRYALRKNGLVGV